MTDWEINELKKFFKEFGYFLGTTIYLIVYISMTYTLLALPFGDSDNLLTELTQQIDYPTYVAIIILGINIVFMQFYPMYHVVKYFLQKTIWLKKEYDQHFTSKVKYP